MSEKKIIERRVLGVTQRSSADLLADTSPVYSLEAWASKKCPNDCYVIAHLPQLDYLGIPVLDATKNGIGYVVHTPTMRRMGVISIDVGLLKYIVEQKVDTHTPHSTFNVFRHARESTAVMAYQKSAKTKTDEAKAKLEKHKQEMAATAAAM